MRLFLCTPERQASSIAEHERILEALRAHDPAAAGQAMEKHLDMVHEPNLPPSRQPADVFETKIDESAVA
jgi:DNA-binding GntR family transcriptional regulator